MPNAAPKYDRYAPADYELTILDGGNRYVVKDDYLRLISSIEIDQAWDGADALTINFRAWDERDLTWRVAGERIFGPGTSLLVKAGYGNRMTVMNRFDIGDHEFSGGESGADTGIIGYDGFAQAVDDEWPAKYGAAPTYTSVAQAMAAKRGWGFVGDRSKPIQHLVKKKRRRTRKGRKTVKYQSEIAKSASDSDAKMLKDLANFSGFHMPKVRYIEADSDVLRRLQSTHDIVQNVGNKDVLFFRRGKLSRQREESAAWKFVYMADAGETSGQGDNIGTLSSFDGSWDAGQVPLAVRVTGYVGATKEVTTVEAQVVTDELLRQGFDGPIVVGARSVRKFTKREKKDFKKGNLAPTQLEILGERQAAKAWHPVEKRYVQTLKREVLRAMPIMRTVKDLEALARGWLQLRMDMHIHASATISNVPGAELIYPNNVYEVTGVPPEYDGSYMVREATHKWSADGHSVAMKLQKVPVVPASMKLIGRAKTETPAA